MKKSEVQNKRSQTSEVLHGEAPSLAATAGASADRGPAAAAAVESTCPVVRGGSEAAALSEGAPLPCRAATVAAIADRGKVEAASCRLRSQDGSSTLAVHFYIANHRGDTVLVIGESGAAESHLQYDAFGNVVAKSGNFTPSYTFSTKEHLPGANLYTYAYRVYDPHAGRWTQRDPIDYQDSVNLYQFCENNGVNTSDPDGRENYLTAADPEYAYNWDLNNRNTTFAGDAFNQRMAAMFKGATIAAVGAGAVALYGPAVLAYVKMKVVYLLGLAGGSYQYFVNRGGQITTVLGSRADCSSYFGRYGYNVLDPAKSVSVLENARFIVEEVLRGDNFLFATDPAKHAMLMRTITETTGKLTTSRYLWLEIPMLQHRLIQTPPQE